MDKNKFLIILNSFALVWCSVVGIESLSHGHVAAGSLMAVLAVLNGLCVVSGVVRELEKE